MRNYALSPLPQIASIAVIEWQPLNSYFYGRASVGFSLRNLVNCYKGKTHIWPISSTHHLVKEHNRNKQPGLIGKTLGLALLADILTHFYFLVMWTWQRGRKTTFRSQLFPSVTWALELDFSCQGEDCPYSLICPPARPTCIPINSF